MAGAGLAAVMDIRWLFLLQSFALLVVGSLAFVLPGLGQPAAEWRRAVQLLRGAKVAPGLGLGRAATLADFDRLAVYIPALAALSPRERLGLAAQTLVAEAPAGATVVRKGEQSDAAYFIIQGRAVAGWDEEGGYRPLETLNAGDFFGEIAALTGALRKANVVAEEPTTVLQVPAGALRRMTAHPDSGYPDCRPEFVAAFERLADHATRAGVEGRSRFRVHTPLIALTKAQIVCRGHELGVDFSLTWSWYAPEADGRACGLCDACQLRHKGFAEACLVDSVPVATRP